MCATCIADLMEAKRAIIFDLFHTLTALESTLGDNRPLTHVMLGLSKEAWDEQLHARSRERLIGARKDAHEIVREMARAINPQISDEVVLRATENRIAQFAAALRQIPSQTQHVLRTLRLSGKRVGLISNADVMEVAAWSECPIRADFDATVFSCHVGCVKPEAEIYHRCLRDLAVDAEDTIFVGDGGSNELEGARAVGMTTVLVTGIISEIWPDRIPARRVHADFEIESVCELLPPTEETPKLQA